MVEEARRWPPHKQARPGEHQDRMPAPPTTPDRDPAPLANDSLAARDLEWACMPLLFIRTEITEIAPENSLDLQKFRDGRR